MRFASAASILLAFVAVAPAGATGLPDGTLISSAPCEPMRDMTYALYLKRQKLAVSREMALAEREGIAMPPIPDEFGGDDIDDVRALIPLAERLGYVDMDNVFAFGG